MANARFVGPRVKSVCGITKNGYLLIVPLRPANGLPPVLLNRGWVPAEWRDAHAAGRWEVLGGAAPTVAQFAVLRDSETASSFVPDNTEQQWFWVRRPTPAPPHGHGLGRSASGHMAGASADLVICTCWRGARGGGGASLLQPLLQPLAVISSARLSDRHKGGGCGRQVDIPHLATSCGLPASAPLLDALQPEGSTPSLDHPPVPSRSIASTFHVPPLPAWADSGRSFLSLWKRSARIHSIAIRLADGTTHTPARSSGTTPIDMPCCSACDA